MKQSPLSDVYASIHPSMWLALYILMETLEEQIHNFNIVKSINLFIISNSFCVLFKKFFCTYFRFYTDIYMSLTYMCMCIDRQIDRYNSSSRIKANVCAAMRKHILKVENIFSNISNIPWTALKRVGQNSPGVLQGKSVSMAYSNTKILRL